MKKSYDLQETREKLAKKVREIAMLHGIELDEEGEVRLSTPDILEKDGSASWKSADGLSIPKTGTPARTRWDKAFVNRVTEVFPSTSKKPFMVPIDSLDRRNPPVNGARLDLYSRMAAGDKLPPILVQRQGERWYVVDGNHRMSAAKTAGLTHLEALEMPPHQKPKKSV